MNKIYTFIERLFELLTLKATKVLGNSITFILALCLVIFWWIHSFIISRNLHDCIGDFIFGTTFLSLFIIQKSFNRYSALVHLKLMNLSLHMNLLIMLLWTPVKKQKKKS